LKLITDHDFEPLVLNAKIPVLLDFFGTWCAPCKKLHPVLEAIEREYDGKLTILQINVDDHQTAAERFGIRSVPTCLLFVDGGLVNQFSGFQSKPFIIKMLNKHLPLEV
jgi:thioredoxin